MKSRIHKAYIGFSSSLAFLAFCLIIDIMILPKTKTYVLISSQNANAAIILLSIIFFSGAFLLIISALHLLIAFRKLKEYRVAIAVFSAILVCILLFTSYFFISATAFVKELLVNEDGLADPGILSIIPNFNARDYQINKKDREIYQLLDTAMCAEMCPCNSNYQKFFFEPQYINANFVAAVEDSVKIFYPECSRQYPANFTFTDEKTLDILRIIEPIYGCSGITKQLLFYETRSLSQGAPSSICGEIVHKDFAKAAVPEAIMMILCAINLILLLPTKYRFLKEQYAREEEERQVLLKKKSIKEKKKQKNQKPRVSINE